VAVFNQTATIFAEAKLTISIPAIEVEASVVDVNLKQFADGSVTWDVSRLTNEVGYMVGTAWFNSGGNVVLGAHSELAMREPGVFYDLDKLQPGDDIYVQEDNAEWHYVVTDVIYVSNNDVSVVSPTTSERLTLITCDVATFDDGDYSGRVVVLAEPAH
jgi:LPXTG-site transpeptidase (sortase) family protein